MNQTGENWNTNTSDVDMAASIFGTNILRDENNSKPKEQNPTLDLLNASNNDFVSPDMQNPTLDLLSQGTNGGVMNTAIPFANEENPTLGLLNQAENVTDATTGFSFIPLREESSPQAPSLEPMNGGSNSPSMENNNVLFPQSNMNPTQVSQQTMVQQSLDSLFQNTNNQ